LLLWDVFRGLKAPAPSGKTFVFRGMKAFARSGKTLVFRGMKIAAASGKNFSFQRPEGFCFLRKNDSEDSP
jgi:hypothetical protein